MLYRSLNLPDRKLVSHLNGTGNHAVDKYYKFPYSFFYQKKLKLILSLMDDHYDNIMDFGAGPARIFSPELRKRCDRLVSWNMGDTFNPHWRFSAIVCASVLEFTQKPYDTIYILMRMLKPGGHLLIGSPMDTPISRLYFKSIKDTRTRWSHLKIREAVDTSKLFKIDKYREWMGLYFAMRVVNV